MKRWLRSGIACWLSLGFVACGGGASRPKTPTDTVKAVFARINAVKDATAKAKAKGSSEAAAKDLERSKVALDALFLDPQRGKLLLLPIAFLDLEDVEFLGEKIDGNTAQVTIEHTVAGIGGKVELQESARKRRQVTFQLRKVEGNWKIADIGGILGRFGR